MCVCASEPSICVCVCVEFSIGHGNYFYNLKFLLISVDSILRLIDYSGIAEICYMLYEDINED